MKPLTLTTGKWMEAAAFVIVGLLGALMVYTRRAELALLLGVPLALVLVTKFRTAVAMTTWVTLIWLSRIPAVFLGLSAFSYVVYLCFALTVTAYLARVAVPSGRPLPIVRDPWIWVFIATIVAGSVHGAMQVDGIPLWLLGPENADYSSRWVYLRTIALPGVLLPGLAILVAVSICDGQRLRTILLPVCVLVWTFDLLIVGTIATSPNLTVLATQRNEHLTDLGFHSNELGTMLAIAYALLLGTREGITEKRSRTVLAMTLWVTAVSVVLTFSRGAFLAFAVTNALYFLRASTAKKVAAVVVCIFLVLIAPAIFVERVQYGIDSGDLNEISAGRLDSIWAPLIPDIAENLLVGQGLHSIMWTNAQRLQQIFPVAIAHNAYLDLLLDLGLVGGVLVLAWYVQLWRQSLRLSRTETDPVFRAFFYGAHLSLVSLSLCALVNDRLTPTSPTACLWIVFGVILGRAHLKRHVSPVRETIALPQVAGAGLQPWHARSAARQTT
jgi:O-antigen ligase